ncbi:MAG: D-2-hydroxyacid dehydrogenase [Gammaproteobacteria bacterium]|nr:D-2-hydroxyacid dehydrogenase [Gammaproteobacteria bacterium]
MTKQPIYIASRDAIHYQEILSAKLGPEVSMGVAALDDEVLANYNAEPVVLGSPDLLTILLATHPPVSWVQSTWAGVRPLIELPFRDYVLTGVKDVFGPQMAEYVLGHVLAHELRLVQRAESQRVRQWDKTSSGRATGKTLGVMGTGSIGSSVAQMALQLGLKVLGFNSSGMSTQQFEQVYSGDSLHAFLGQCDYVTGILPDLAATTDLLNAEAFAAMKPSALLINVGRGNLIDETALCAGLHVGQPSAAVLDVFRQEPLAENSPLWTAPNCTITAHVAAESCPKDITRLFLHNYLQFQHNQPLDHVVDFEKGY